MLEIGEKAVLGNLKKARRNGQLNLIGLELKEVPKQVALFSELTFDDNWWELVPLTKLDMSNNEIQSIPDDLNKEKDIQLIRMQNNKLTSLPSTLFSLSSLKSIDFSKNSIKQLPYSLVQCHSLVEINLSENKIEELPPNMHYLQNLESLNVSQNNLRAVPLFLEKTPLKRVDFSDNKICFIPQPAFQGCLLLENLILSKNTITAVEDGAFQNLKSIVNLFLDQNKLTIYEEIPLSEKLDQLTLSHNRIESFSKFSNMPNLSALIINNNKLKFLDKSILQCKNIKTLDLTNNDLPDLPSEVGLLPKLVRFSVEGNPLKCIRNNIKNAGAEVLKKYLRDRIQGDYSAVESQMDPKMNFITKQIDPIEVLIREFYRNNELIISNQNLQNLDDDRLYRLQGLTHLDISNNKIQTIPDKIQNYEKSLNKFHANNSGLQQVPQGILKLVNLQSLELKQNNLTMFFDQPNSFSESSMFMNLQNLDLSINKIKNISGLIINNMPSLRVLNLAYNSISDFTPLLSKTAKLNKLEVIDISNNCLTELSEQIAYTLPALQNLNLENNNLQKIPTELGFMKLKTLKIDGNPLKLIKRAVIEKGSVSIMDHLRTRHVGNPPTDLACNRPIVEEIDNTQELENQQNFFNHSDPYRKRQNHQYGQLNQQQQQQPQQNFGFGRGGLFKSNQNDIQNQQNQFQQQRVVNYQNSQMQIEQSRGQGSRMEVEYPPQQQQQAYGLPQQQQQQFQQQQQQYQQPNLNTGQQMRANRVEIEKQIYELNGRIVRMENEIADNFSLNKFQLNEKKKDLQSLKLQRSKLQSDLQ